MKVSILGGGPAGIYFAISLKSMLPDCEVEVYEARNESIHSLGLGYTLQTLGHDLLARQDKYFLKKLFSGSEYMRITQALFKTNSDSQYFDFTEGFSVSRFQLMSYLLARAETLGVKLKQKKFSSKDALALQKSSDLLVAADGVNSVVRQVYGKQFGANEHAARLRYSWFTNESEQQRTEACFYAFQAEEGTITLTSYPLTHHKQVVVIELTEATSMKGNFKNKTPAESAKYLSEILSSNGDIINLESAGLPWYSFTLNTVETPTYKNIALVGDSAFSFHYSMGQGVSTAFTMGYMLANCIAKSSDIHTALKKYSASISMTLKEPTQTSVNSMLWLENMDEFFANTPTKHHIELFRLKNNYRAPVSTSDSSSKKIKV